MNREQRIARADEIFAHVWGDEGKRNAWNALDDCISDLYSWAEEVESDPGPHRISNAKIANELRLLAERLTHLDLQERAS